MHQIYTWGQGSLNSFMHSRSQARSGPDNSWPIANTRHVRTAGCVPSETHAGQLVGESTRPPCSITGKTVAPVGSTAPSRRSSRWQQDMPVASCWRFGRLLCRITLLPWQIKTAQCRLTHAPQRPERLADDPSSGTSSLQSAIPLSTNAAKLTH
jgi:hypothetical protein